MERIPISEIRVGERHRKDLGDMASLARSMRDIGLLQPVGVTNKNELVFGERRLKAAEELGWKMIHAVRVNLESIIDGEYAENEIRKDFTVSERVAIGQAIESKLGKRRGNRTDKELPVNLPEVQQGKESREIAAEKAGFGSEKTYRDAKKVVDEAEPEVKEAMDSGDVSISDAAAVATAKPSVQRAAVKAVESGQSKTLKAAAADHAKSNGKPKPGKPIFDDRIIGKIVGQLVRAIDARAKAFGKGNGFADCEKQLELFEAAWKRWQRETTGAKK